MSLNALGRRGGRRLYRPVAKGVRFNAIVLLAAFQIVAVFTSADEPVVVIIAGILVFAVIMRQRCILDLVCKIIIRGLADQAVSRHSAVRIGIAAVGALPVGFHAVRDTARRYRFMRSHRGLDVVIRIYRQCYIVDHIAAGLAVIVLEQLQYSTLPSATQVAATASWCVIVCAS